MIGAKPNLKAAREAQKAAEAKSKAATGSTTTTTTTGTMSTANMGNYFSKVSLIITLSRGVNKKLMIIYRISANSFHGNYSFLKVEIVEIFI
jgi:hypothetical protein